MAPTACGSAAIFIDSTACCRTLVCSNSKHHPFSPEGKPAVGGSPPAGLLSYFLYVNRLQCNMPSCSCLFQQQAPSTPPRGEPARRRHPAARAPRRSCGAGGRRRRGAGLLWQRKKAAWGAASWRSPLPVWASASIPPGWTKRETVWLASGCWNSWAAGSA